MRDFPSFAGYFFVYEASKRLVAKHRGQPECDLTTLQLLFCGGIAGFGAWIPCYPQDVIKSRIQGSQSTVGIFETIIKIWQEKGARGFLRGFGPTMVRAFPANAATFFAYEYMHSYLSHN